MIKLGNNNFFEIKYIAEKFQIDETDIQEILEEYNVKSVGIGCKEYVLEDEFMKIFKHNENINESKNHDESTRIYPITESEIIDQTIKLLKEVKEISIKELREMLKERMNLSKEDYQINKNRNDTKFDQKVRNMISHRENNDLNKEIEYIKKGKEGILRLREE